jgi:hypothetical protein
MTAHSWARRRREPDPGPLLMDAVDSIADMAQRVKRNGPELTYAAEKLTWALTGPPRRWQCAAWSSTTC